MKQTHILLFIIFALTVFAILPARAETPPATDAGRSVTYKDGEEDLEGYWMPSQCGQESAAPVVLIIHQWMGVGDYETMRAGMLAAQCYNAFAIDMYGKGVRPQTREDAAALSAVFKKDPNLARRRAIAALTFVHSMKGQPGIDTSRIAVMGYCFGGSMALELARSGAPVNGVISFHGGLSSPAPVAGPGVISTPIQIHHGAADPFVPQEDVLNFMIEMDQAGADWQLTQYANAVHAFTEEHAGNDPSSGVAYNEKADHRSWAATLDFLREIFAAQ